LVEKKGNRGVTFEGRESQRWNIWSCQGGREFYGEAEK